MIAKGELERRQRESPSCKGFLLGIKIRKVVNTSRYYIVRVQW
jgi:hypothetical protein